MHLFSHITTRRQTTPHGEVLLAVCLLVQVTFTVPADAETHCSEQTVCVQSVRHEHFVDIFVIDKKAFDVTVGLALTFRNMRLEPLQNDPETYIGRSRTPAARLHVKNRKVRWKYRYTYDWVRGSLYATHEDGYIYALPYESGHGYKVAQSFNGDFSHFGDDQYAVDFSMPVGTAIYAAREGMVVGVKEDSSTGGPSEGYKRFGNYVIVQHADHTLGEYFHLKRNGALVHVRQSVKRGDLIGLSGDTGHANGAHLHFGVYGALSGKARRSFPIRFQAQRGIIDRPLKGERYIAP